MTDAFAIKLDRNGNRAWARNFGSSGVSASIGGIAVDATGSIYAGGSFGGANMTTPMISRIGNGSFEPFILKLESSGTNLWAKNYGPQDTTTIPNDIKTDALGNVSLTGVFTTGFIFGRASPERIFNAFAERLDPSGETLFAKSYRPLGPGASTYGTATAVDAEGSLYVAGGFNGVKMEIDGISLSGVANGYLFIAKFSAIGKVLWAKNFGAGGASGIAVDSSGNVYVSGSVSSGNLTNPKLTKLGDLDAFAMKLDSKGDIVWT